MSKKAPLFFGIYAVCLIAVMFAAPDAAAQDDTWSVSAANWMQYWYHRPEPFDSLNFTDRQSREDSLDNRFIVDFDFGDFYAGAWLRILHPERPDTSYERITQRYFGWNQDGFNLHAGNFYQTFDRGLTLNTFYDDAVNFDNNLDGIRVSGLYDHFEFNALSASPLNDRLSYERDNTLRAVRGVVKPILGTRAGFSYVRFKQNDFEDFTNAINSNVTSFNAGVNRGPFEVYGEYAYRRGQPQFMQSVDGDGTYLSGSFSHSLFSIYSEYKNIINLLYPTPVNPLNMPPPVSHSGRSLTSLANVNGERAYQIGTLISPSFNLNTEFAYSESYERTSSPRRLYLAEKYGSVRWNPHEKLVVSYRWDRHDYSMDDEVENNLEAYYYLDAEQSISANGYTRRFYFAAYDYHEDNLVLGYARGGFIQLSVGGSLSNKSDKTTSFDPDKLAYAELTIRFKSNELIIFQGGERGGLVCSSGICTVRPTFQGTRVILFSRF